MKTYKMKNSVKLSEVVALARENGHLGWIKINDAKKVVANASGTLQLNTTMFLQNFVQKEAGDEIVMFGKKQLNVTKLEKELSRFVGLEVSLFVGGKSLNGILS